MIKLKNRKNLFKGAAWVFIGLFFCTLISIPKVQPKAEPVNNDLEILEIEPGNQFLLGDANKNIDKNADFISQETVDGFNLDSSLSGKKIRITHVTMQQFISQVDQINGKYDVVVIGRDNNGLRKGHNSTNTNLNTYVYSDYTNPLTETSKKTNLIDEGYIPEGYGWRNIKNGDLVENKAYYEYYSENDITKKRAKEIISLIDSGQPVYIDNKIFDGTLSKTNLVSQFESKINNVNCWKFSSDDNGILNGTNFNNTATSGVALLKIIAINNIKTALTSGNQTGTDVVAGQNIDKKNKRPVVSIVTAPTGDSSGAVGNISNRKMKFTINISDNIIVGEKLRVNLYLDVSGDTIFSDKELYYQGDMAITNEAGNYKSITYNMPSEFIGYLDWKVEVVRTLKDGSGSNLKNANGDNIEVKSYKTGSLTLNQLQGQAPKVIKVLQIYPNTNLNNMDLTSDTTIKNTLLPQVKGYDLQITKKTVAQFNTMVDENNSKNQSLPDKDKKSVLNGNYNMVIIGFYDSYGGSGSGKFSGASVEEIRSFIRTGQSVMFTHDTVPITIKDTFSPNNGPKIIGQNFRDAIGQARYIDEYNTNQKDIYSEYRATKDANGFISGGEYIERIIPHDVIQQKDSNTPTYSYGYASGIIAASGNSPSNAAYPYYSTSNNVYKLNKGLITQYPFELGDIPVATTHHQWYQLNLEDPDVVPWYTIKLNPRTDSSAWQNQYSDKYDARNNYYTYSKGNITYSGTGHSGIGGQINELKLFVNTMIKAERGANHSPIVACSITNEYKVNDESSINEVPQNMDYSFSVDANDLDKDKVYIEVKINGNPLGEENVTMSKLNNNLFEVDTRQINRSPLIVTIPSNKLQKETGDVTIEIKAKDIQGAESETKIYKIRPIEMPLFRINAVLDESRLKKIDSSGNLLSTVVSGRTVTVRPGDNINVSYNVTPEGIKYGNVSECESKEVSVLIDDSLLPSTWAQFKGGLNDALKKLLETGYMRYNIITFGKDSAKIYEEASSTDGLKNNLTMENLGSNIGKAESNGKKINSALNLSVDFFNDSDFQTNAISKTIMIFSKGNVESVNEQIKSLIKDNYNVITVQISEDGTLGSLKSTHNTLGGLNSDYFICNPNHKGSENDSPDTIMGIISDNISRLKYKTYMVDNIEMNFNLGDKIALVNGLTQAEPDTNKYKQILPKVKYIVDTDEEGNIITDNGKLSYKGYFIDDTRPNVTDELLSYKAEFKITSAEGAHGLCEFSDSAPNDNIVKYKYFGTNSYGSTHISTPKLLLDEITVDHGVYKGLSEDGHIEYLGDYSGSVDGSVATFAASINNLYSNSTKLLLTIDENCEIVSIPTIYRITAENRLEKLKDSSGNNLVFAPTSENNYGFNNFDGTTNNNIVVLYSVRFKGFPDEPNKAYTYQNIIKADEYYAIANVPRKIGDKLPELF